MDNRRDFGGGGGGDDDDRRGRRDDRDDRDRDRGDRPDRGFGRGRFRHAAYCPDGKCFDWKDVDTLRKYISETGKIKPRRQTGNCSRCQRQLSREIKRARHMAMLPFMIVTD